VKHLFPALLLLAACSGGLPQPDMVRANARAAVAVAKSTYVVVGTACVDAVQLTGDKKIAMACADALDPAYHLILDAANAVDSGWTAAAACELVQGIAYVARGSTAMGALSASLAPAVRDGQLLAAALLGPTACPGITAPAAPAAPADAGGGQ
jgi:hypothetical protein